MLADIGNGTMNIMYIVDKKPQEGRCWTEKLGVNQCMIRARNAVMDKYAASIDESIVERILRFGTADISEKFTDVIRSVAEEYVENIFAALRKYEYDPDLVKLHIVGGGACLVKNLGKYDPDRVEINEDICATAKGYEYLAYQMLRRGR
jgi:plasmid segregation protein ParM